VIFDGPQPSYGIRHASLFYEVLLNGHAIADCNPRVPQGGPMRKNFKGRRDRLNPALRRLPIDG